MKKFIIFFSILLIFFIAVNYSVFNPIIAQADYSYSLFSPKVNLNKTCCKTENLHFAETPYFFIYADSNTIETNFIATKCNNTNVLQKITCCNSCNCIIITSKNVNNLILKYQFLNNVYVGFTGGQCILKCPIISNLFNINLRSGLIET